MNEIEEVTRTAYSKYYDVIAIRTKNRKTFIQSQNHQEDGIEWLDYYGIEDLKDPVKKSWLHEALGNFQKFFDGQS